LAVVEKIKDDQLVIADFVKNVNLFYHGKTSDFHFFILDGA
jgi:hypothetical protein